MRKMLILSLVKFRARSFNRRKIIPIRAIQFDDEESVDRAGGHDISGVVDCHGKGLFKISWSRAVEPFAPWLSSRRRRPVVV